MRNKVTSLIVLMLAAGGVAFDAPSVTAAPGAATPDPSGGVYVRDSDVAVDKFAQADRMERLGEWGKAADVYQELLQKQADRVVALSSDATRYQSVVEAVQGRLCQWPPEALGIYRDRFGAEAQSLLEQSEAEHREDGADDAVGLHRVLANYFITDAAKLAGMRLMDAAFENAEFSEAAAIGNELLKRHPLLLDDRARLLYRTALTEHYLGNASAAEAKNAELKQKFPATLGTVRGKDVVLADSLSEELGQSITQALASTGESWPMPFGAADRARIPAVSGLDGARLFSVPLDDGLSHPPPGALASVKQTIERNRKLGYTLGVVPVVDRGELFFQDNAHIYAVSLESGLTLPGWEETYPGNSKGRYSMQAWPMPASRSSTLCVTDDSVLAVMGFVDSSPVLITGRMSRATRLVCLDRQSGRERWTFEPMQLPAEPAALRQLTISGDPLVIGDNVYLFAAGGQGVQFVDCYVLCLNRTTGAYKWSSYIASANDPNAMFNPEGTSATPDAAGHLAYFGGRLFITTDVGAVASLDATDGAIQWLNLYPRDVPTLQYQDRLRWNRVPNAQLSNRHSKPWTTNPIIVRGGKVFACPADAASLFVYDADSGAPLQQVGLSYKASLDKSGPAEIADTLVGITGERGDAAILASDRTVFCVQLDQYDPARGMDNLRWLETWTQAQPWPEDSIRGRPFLTKDAVIVPLAWSLVSLSLRNGATQTMFPSSGMWDTTVDGPGNVLATADHLIIAGAQHVNVYTDLAVATRRLDRAIEENPTDAQLRLRYAEMLFATRRYDGPNGALAKLDEAAKLLGVDTGKENGSPVSSDDHPTEGHAAVGSAGDAPGDTTMRSRLFTDALNFALTADTAGETVVARGVVNSLFDHAAAAAATPAEQVTYRLRRAEHLRRANDPRGELAAYQQILSDPRLRSVTVSESGRGSTLASGFVYQAIAELIKRSGAEIYQPYNDTAASMLAAAQQTQDVTTRRDQLIDLADAYPNTKSAGDAILLAASDQEKLGDPRAAASLLRKYASRYTDSDKRAIVLESLARLYLSMTNRADRISVAIGRLEQGAKLPNSPRLKDSLLMPDGSTLRDVTFEEAATALRKFQASVETDALPDPHIPAYVRAQAVKATLLPEEPAATVKEVNQIVKPLDGWSRNDRLVTFSQARGLQVFAIGSSQPLITAANVNDQPRNIAWMNGNLLVWCPTRLLLIRGDEPDAAATRPTSQPAGDNQAGDKTAGDKTAGDKPAADHSVAAGALLWEATLQSLPVAQLALINSGANGGVNGGDGSGGGGGAGGADNEPGDIVNLPPDLLAQRVARANMLMRGLRLNVNGQQNANGRAVVANAAAHLAAPPTEQIDHLVVGTDRIVFSTVMSGTDPIDAGSINPGSDGLAAPAGSRLISINVADGHVVWQTRMSNRRIDHLVANDDFVAVRAADDADVQLIAFDAQSGQPVWSPAAFTRSNNDLAAPVNLALAQDGSLVYVLPDRVCCKDLFDPDPKLRFDRPVMRGNVATTFAGFSGPDQLIVRDGRIIVFSDGGAFVRMYSLAEGRPVSRGDGADLPLNTHVTPTTWNVHMRAVGDRLYIVGPQMLVSYGLGTDPDNYWNKTVQNTDGKQQTSIVIQDMLLTPDNVLLFLVAPQTLGNIQINGVGGINGLQGINIPQGVNGLGVNGAAGNAMSAPRVVPTTVTLRMFSRAILPSGHESGIRPNFDRTITDATGITDEQVVDGGVYYLAGDRQLHFLRGTP